MPSYTSHPLLLGSLLLPLALLGCGDKDGGSDNGGTADDTGGGGPSYEEGCITVDGGGGYAWINDAVEVASEGSTIELCASTGHEEAVVVDKGVSIVGPGSDQFLLLAPTNEMGITIAASGVSLSGVSVDSTRSGVVVDEGAGGSLTGVSLEDISVVGAGNWGLKTTNAEVTATDLELSENAYGGLSVDGGSVTVDASTLADNMAYGIKGTDDAVVTLTNSTISGTTWTDETNPEDGHGVYLDESATLITTDNEITGSSFINILGEGANIDLSGDTLDGGYYSAVLFTGAVSVSGVTATNAINAGFFFSTEQAIEVVDVTVTTDPEASANMAYDSFGVDGFQGAGMLLFSPEVTVDTAFLGGWNNAGMYVASDSDAAGTAEISAVSMLDVGRYGLAVEYSSTTITDLEISGLRDPDDADETDCYYVNYIAGVYGIYATIDWTGGSLSSNEGWGASSVYGPLTVEGVTFDSNECSAIVGYQGALTLLDNTFTGMSSNGVVNSNFDSGLWVEGNTFSGTGGDGVLEYFYDYMDDYGYTYSQTYENYATTVDIYGFGSSSATIKDNVFEDGDTGVYMAGATAEISGNTFTGYRSTPLQLTLYDESSPGDYTVSDTVITGWGGDAIYCYGTSVELENVELTGGLVYEYSYSYTYEYSDGSSVTYGPYTSRDAGAALYANGCQLLADGLTISDHQGQGIQLYTYNYDGVYELNDVNIETVGQSDYAYNSAVYAYGYRGDSSMYFNDVSITDAQSGHALYIAPTNSTYYSATASLDATGLTISGAESAGLYLSRGTAELQDLTVSGTGTYGLQVYRGDLSVSTATIVEPGYDGVNASYSTATLDGLTITSPGAYGVWWQNGDDYDGDGYSVAEGDCDDTDSSRYPGATETTDYVDDDCDGIADDGTDTADNDGDGYSIAAGDCHDSDYSTYPGAEEVSWRQDNNCDGVVDDTTEDELSLTNSTITGAAEAGIYIDGLSPTLTGNTVSDGAGWGLECETTDFDACSSNVVSGNLGGELSGCPETCTQ